MPWPMPTRTARGDQAALLAELGQLNARMDQSQAWGLEQQIRDVLDRLGVRDLNRRMGDLSGRVPQAPGPGLRPGGRTGCSAAR